MILDKHHVILYGAAILLALFGVYLLEARVADRAQSKADAAEGKAQLIAQQNAQFQAQVTQQLSQLAAQNAQLAVQNAQLTAAISQRDAVLKQTQAQIPSMTQDAVAANVTAGLKVPATEFVSASDGGYKATRVAANAILGSIEELSTTKADLRDSETQLSNLHTAVANDESALQVEKDSHVSDVNAVKAETVACKAEVKAVKAKARKNILKAFGIGYIAGFISAHMLGF